MVIAPRIRNLSAGHRGMAGRAIERRLRTDGYTNLITRSRCDLDLANQRVLLALPVEQPPEYRFATEAKIGSIQTNNQERTDAMSVAAPHKALS